MRDDLCYTIDSGTNTETVLRFVKHLIQTWKFNSNTVIVLDRHPCHDVEVI
jgi:hypothetical protein